MTLIADATCDVILTTGCTTLGSLSTVTGTAITAITFVGTTPSVDATPCPPAGCFVSSSGYGYSGTGYGYGIAGSGLNGYLASGYGYGDASGTLVLNFLVTITPTSLTPGHYWMTFIVNTGSGVIGSISSPATYFQIVSGNGGGGGGSGSGSAGSGSGQAPTVTAPTATTTTTTSTGAQVATATATATTSGPANVQVDLSQTQSATSQADTGVTLNTLTLNMGQAVNNVQVSVTASTDAAAVAAATGSFPNGFVNSVFLDIQVTGAPAGALQGASLGFTMTPAQLQGKNPATVTFVHFTNGQWVQEPSSFIVLPNGNVQFTATFSSLSPFAIVFDNAPPTISNVRPADGSQASTRPVIAATITDNRGANFTATRMLVDGQPVTFTPSGSDILYTPAVALTPGLHRVNVTAVDLSGLSTSKAWSFTASATGADQTPPTVEVGSPAKDSFTNNPRPAISATYHDNVGIDLAKVLVKIDGADAVGPAITATGVTVTPAVGLTDGAHTVTVTVTDTSGNSNFVIWTFTVDTAAPKLASTEPANGATAGLRPTLKATFTEPNLDPSRVTMTLDGKPVQPTVVGNTVSYTPSSDLSGGAHTASVTATDKAGNAETKSWTFTAESGAGGPLGNGGLIAIVLLVLVVVGVGAWWYMKRGPGKGS